MADTTSPAARVQCPACGSAKAPAHTRRSLRRGGRALYRACRGCGHRFTTYDGIQGPRPMRADCFRHAKSAVPLPCNTCKRLLPPSCFNKVGDSHSVYRLKSKCKECHVRRIAELKRNKKLADLGITREDYDRAVAAQNGVCAICGRPPMKRGKRSADAVLAIDHCHATLRFRALLCNQCNLGLGAFEDDPGRLIAAAEYVRRHSPPAADLPA